jgi:hypothetical protein
MNTFRPANLTKAGTPMEGYDIVSVIFMLLVNLSEDHLLEVIQQCTQRLEQLRAEKLRILNDKTGWWRPKTADEVMTDEAKMLILGIFHPTYNPKTLTCKIRAIKALRAEIPDPDGGRLGLRDSKDLVDAYEFGVRNGLFEYPSYLYGKDWPEDYEYEEVISPADDRSGSSW